MKNLKTKLGSDAKYFTTLKIAFSFRLKVSAAVDVTIRSIESPEKKRGQDIKSVRVRLSTTDEKDSGKKHQSHRHTHRKHHNRNRDVQQS